MTDIPRYVYSRIPTKRRPRRLRRVWRPLVPFPHKFVPSKPLWSSVESEEAVEAWLIDNVGPERVGWIVRWGTDIQIADDNHAMMFRMRFC